MKLTSHPCLTMECMWKLYDCDCWYSINGSKGKQVVFRVHVCKGTFTTLQRFFTDIWSKVVTYCNRLADHILMMYQDCHQMEIEETEQCMSHIQQSLLKGLRTVYEHIYIEHHYKNPVEYTLTASTHKLYIKYCKGKTKMSSSSVRLILSAMSKQGKTPSGWP